MAHFSYYYQPINDSKSLQNYYLKLLHKPLHIDNISFISNFMWILSIYTPWLLNIKYAKKLLLAKKTAKRVVEVWVGVFVTGINVLYFQAPALRKDSAGKETTDMDPEISAIYVDDI